MNSKQTFAYVDTEVWRAVWRWCLNRHQNKSKDWVYRKYFKRTKQSAWTFFATVPDSNMEPVDILLKQISKIPIKNHVKVKGAASPDDPTLRNYWYERQTKRSAGSPHDENYATASAY